MKKEDRLHTDLQMGQLEVFGELERQQVSENNLRM